MTSQSRCIPYHTQEHPRQADILQVCQLHHLQMKLTSPVEFCIDIRDPLFRELQSPEYKFVQQSFLELVLQRRTPFWYTVFSSEKVRFTGNN
jgi:hypothetical protein